MARRREIPWGLWLGCLVAALLAHGVLVVPSGRALARSLGGGFKPAEVEERVLSLDLVEPEPLEPEQFVELDDANDRAPKHTRRVAARNSDVERETKAPPGREGAPSVAGTTLGQQAKPSDPVEQGDAPDDPAKLAHADDGQLPGAAPSPSELAKEWGKLGGSPGMLHDSFGTSGRPDHLPTVEPGRESMLDSKAHLYASFFTRMRGRILEHWNAQKAIDRHDPHTAQLGAVARTTVVRVRLDRSGAIDALSFERESGVDYLDAEAIRALRAAGPFPNPPKGLFDGEDDFTITVAFTVEPDGGARVFRYSR